MDMEHELQALRTQLAEKSKRAIQLQKEVFPTFYPFLWDVDEYDKYKLHVIHAVSSFLFLSFLLSFSSWLWLRRGRRILFCMN